MTISITVIGRYRPPVSPSLSSRNKGVGVLPPLLPSAIPHGTLFLDISLMFGC